MAWNGSGTFSRTNGVNTGTTVWADDRDAGTLILASRHDTHDQDLATGINACLAKNGENAMTGNLNMGSNKLTSLAAGTTASDGVRYDQVLILSSGVATANLAMGSTYKITGLAAGSTAGDSVRYEQVLLLAGGTMAGNIAMGSNKLTGLAAGSTAGDSVRYEQVLLLAGGTMAGNIAMGSNKLTGLAAGSTAGDSVRYEQVALLTANNTLSGANTFSGSNTFTGTTQTLSAAGPYLIISDSGASNAHIFLRDSSTNRALIYWDRASDQTSIRQYDTDGSTPRAEVILTETAYISSYTNGSLAMYLDPSQNAVFSGTVTGTAFYDDGTLLKNGFVYIGQATGSGASSLAITSGIDSTYQLFALVLEDVIPNSAATGLVFYFGESGPTYLTAASYNHGGVGSLTGGASAFTLQAASHVSNTTGTGMNGIIWLSGLSGSGTYPRAQTDVAYQDDGGTWYYDKRACVYDDGAGSAITAVKIQGSSGNISGTIKLYGLSLT